MRKFKRLLVLILMISTMTSIFATGSDVVVLMDASGTILPYFDEINNRILVDITRKFVRQGDTFHLVSFNSRVNLEIVQPIQTEADISRVVSRFMLLYPLGQNSDFLSGLQFTQQYVSSLDQQRDKIIIVISDGIFNPPATSPYVSFTSEQVRSELSLLSSRIRGAGWNVYYIKLPFPSNAEIRTLDGAIISNGEANGATETTAEKKTEIKTYNDISSEFTSALHIVPSTLPENDIPLTFIDSVFSMPELTFPENMGRKGRFFFLPIKVKNISDTPVNMELTGVFVNDENVLSKNSFLTLSPGSRGTLRAEIQLPKTIEKGLQSLPLRLQFSQNMRVMPQSAVVQITVTSFSPELFFKSGGSFFLVLILIIIALVLVTTLFMFIFHRTERPASNALRSAGIHAETENISAASVVQTKIEKTQKTLTQKNIPITSKKESSSVDKTINYSTEKKQYPSQLEPIKDNTSKTYIDSLVAEQNAEKNERFSVLSAAVKKPEIHASRLSGANANDRIEIKENTKVMLELHVDHQTTNIGKRNIHMMKAGTRLGLGGSGSSFLVFLVKFPPHIAEIRYDGKQCSLAILKPEYFPYETTNVISDCINKQITLVSNKGYEVTFIIRVFEDPVVKLNRLLKSITY